MKRLAAVLNIIVLIFGTFAGAHASENVDVPAIEIQQVKTGNIFGTNDNVSFKIITDADKVQYKAYDYWENEVAFGVEDITLSPHTLTVNMSKKGVFRLVLLAIGAGGITEAETSFAIIDPLDMQNVPSNSPFSVQTHLAKRNMSASWQNIDEVLDMASLLGFKTVRNTIKWDELERQKNVYSFTAEHEKMFTELEEREMQIYFVAAEYNTSFYANWTEDFYEGFADYLEAVVRKFPGRIKWIEVLNEPNTDHGPPGYPDTKAQGAKYAELLKAAYERVKSIDGTIKIVAGATCDNGRTFFRGMFEADVDKDGSQDGTKFCDAISFHMYEANPISAGGQYTATTALLDEFGSDAPIYLSETGLSTIPNGVDTIDENDMGENICRQALFLPVQLIDTVRYMKNGDGLVSLYELLNDTNRRGELEDNFGLFRAKGDEMGSYTPRWSFGTVSVMNRMLNGYEYNSFNTYAPDLHSYLFKKASAELRFMHTYKGKYTVTANAAADVTVTDMMGNSVTISPTAGKVSFKVDECPVYVQGDISNIVSVVATDDNLVYQAENVYFSKSSGVSVSTASSQVFLAEDKGHLFSGSAVNDYVEYKLTVADSGYYKINMRQSRTFRRGVFKPYLNGVPLGGELDCYMANVTYAHNEYLGTAYLTAGEHRLRFVLCATPGGGELRNTLLVDLFSLEKQPNVTLEINEANLRLEEGSFPYRLTAAVSHAGAQVSWRSSNERVARVVDGWVIPSACGTADIIASSGSVSDSCTVAVVGAGSENTILLTEKSINLGLMPRMLIPIIFPDPPNAPVQWKSGDESIVSVDNGVITGKRIGKTTVTAYYGAGSDSCEINVIAAKYPLTKDAFTNTQNGSGVDDTYNTGLLYVRNTSGQDRVTFIGANLPGVEGVEVKRAELFIRYSTFTGGDTYIEYGGGLLPLYAYNGEWDETGEKRVTFSNSGGASLAGLTHVADIDIPADPNQSTTRPHTTMDKFYSADITEYVNGLQNKKVSLKMLGDVGNRAKNGGRYQFFSKEALDAEHHPYILVEVNAPESRAELSLNYQYTDNKGDLSGGLSSNGSVKAIAVVPLELTVGVSDVNMIIALYNGKRLVQVNWTKPTVEEGVTNRIEASLDELPINVDNHSLRTFFWNSELEPILR